MSVQETILRKLRDRFPEAVIDVIDESHLHAGHAGAREGGESHFRLEIISKDFEGMTRVARQRVVNEVLRVELQGPVHALSMRALSPAEVG